jgi:hypothetical protein
MRLFITDGAEFICSTFGNRLSPRRPDNRIIHYGSKYRSKSRGF